MSKPKITQREFLLARAFLKRLGGNIQNTYLILAVIAWTRAMGKAHDPFWSNLKNLSGALAGSKLAAHLLAKAGAGKYKGEYKAIIKRLRQQLGGDKAQASQATDFVLGIEKSHYDKSHYGFKEYVEGHYVTTWQDTGRGYPEQVTTWVPPVDYSNPLYDAWAKLTNHPGIPQSWWTTTVTTKKVVTTPPRPNQPRSLTHVLPSPDYIQPYAAEHFYLARPHSGDNILPGD